MCICIIWSREIPSRSALLCVYLWPAKMAKINGSKQIGQLINQLVNTILKLQTVRVPTAAHRPTIERLKAKQCDSTDVDDIPFEPSAFQND